MKNLTKIFILTLILSVNANAEKLSPKANKIIKWIDTQPDNFIGIQNSIVQTPKVNYYTYLFYSINFDESGNLYVTTTVTARDSDNGEVLGKSYGALLQKVNIKELTRVAYWPDSAIMGIADVYVHTLTDKEGVLQLVFNAPVGNTSIRCNWVENERKYNSVFSKYPYPENYLAV